MLRARARAPPPGRLRPSRKRGRAERAEAYRRLCQPEAVPRPAGQHQRQAAGAAAACDLVPACLQSLPPRAPLDRLPAHSSPDPVSPIPPSTSPPLRRKPWQPSARTSGSSARLCARLLLRARTGRRHATCTTAGLPSSIVHSAGSWRRRPLRAQRASTGAVRRTMARRGSTFRRRRRAQLGRRQAAEELVSATAARQSWKARRRRKWRRSSESARQSIPQRRLVA